MTKGSRGPVYCKSKLMPRIYYCLYSGSRLRRLTTQLVIVLKLHFKMIKWEYEIEIESQGSTPAHTCCADAGLRERLGYSDLN
ncbi:hypothetical protein V7S43_009989 [Phytophthora oleae]|uniref:Uncharacterized protein n=1 Tax=Phytophthora oleae TaxID=2107226 RepID=A0ABD3FH00_9STRA